MLKNKKTTTDRYITSITSAMNLVGDIVLSFYPLPEGTAVR